ncbi:TadE/TadG family type IV pilus assembly protein [Desulfovibrio sp. X2]|uniref:TadE/TadG family type IV pilus assembly protein n=1 Tax=Desulfovibrio sp. X2 TaxID=941449 RepID=UPI001F23F4A0|nr:TadE family protein [Desulfovibrio sp. X2]
MFGRRRDGERGSSVVEFALFFPAMIALSMLLIEGGNMFRAWLTLHKSAQTAVRFATTGQGDEDGSRLSQIVAQARLMQEDLPGNSPVMDVDVCSRTKPDMSLPCTGADPGGPCEMVQVEVRYSYQPLTPFAADLLPSDLTMEATERGINEPWKVCP